MTNSDISRGGKLSERQKKAIPFLVNAPTVEKGCKGAKISRETYYQWLSDPLFKDELKRARDQVIEEALNIIKWNMTRAVNALVGLLKTKNQFLKRSVANDILGHVLKSKELEDIERRIEALERAVKEKRP
jgi:hypothetical protein